MSEGKGEPIPDPVPALQAEIERLKTLLMRESNDGLRSTDMLDDAALILAEARGEKWENRQFGEPGCDAVRLATEVVAELTKAQARIAELEGACSFVRTELTDIVATYGRYPRYARVFDELNGVLVKPPTPAAAKEQ